MIIQSDQQKEILVEEVNTSDLNPLFTITHNIRQQCASLSAPTDTRELPQKFTNVTSSTKYTARNTG